MEEKEYEILKGVKEQISAFDNKASILITALGIIFTLSFSAIDLLTSNDYCWWVYIFFGIYQMSLILSMTFLLLVIVPRKRKNSKVQSTVKSCTYYGDLHNMTKEEFEDLLKQKSYFEQISTISKIAWRKHCYIKRAIITLLPVGIFFLALLLSFLFI